MTCFLPSLYNILLQKELHGSLQAGTDRYVKLSQRVKVKTYQILRPQKCPHRKHFKATVYDIGVHGPSGYGHKKLCSLRLSSRCAQRRAKHHHGVDSSPLPTAPISLKLAPIVPNESRLFWKVCCRGCSCQLYDITSKIKVKIMSLSRRPLIWNHYIPSMYHLRIRAHTLTPTQNQEETDEGQN